MVVPEIVQEFEKLAVAINSPKELGVGQIFGEPAPRARGIHSLLVQFGWTDPQRPERLQARLELRVFGYSLRVKLFLDPALASQRTKLFEIAWPRTES